MNEHLDELMLRWDTARQQGGAVRPEELCADCPELAPALRQRTEAVEAMERVLGVHPGEPERVPTLLAGTVASAHAAEPLPQIPGYEILRVLDQGGMGVVFQARQLDLGRIVAVKMILEGRLAPRDLARFRKEAEAVARLQHPNFVQIFEVGQAHGRPFFSMEYVDGGSLAERIARERPSARVAAELVLTLAQAIHTAHECGSTAVAR
jgi:eukaryotic-like serine/threonine-protein kinase